MVNMGSAHPLVEVNVSFKFEGNPSNSKGVIERTRIGDGRTESLWWGYNKSYCHAEKQLEVILKIFSCWT